MVKRLTLFLITGLIVIVSCDNESFEPDLHVLKKEISEFYEQQSSGDLEGALEHFDQFPYDRDHVELHKKKFLEQNRIGKPEFSGCRVDVVNKYHTRGRLIWLHCDVRRAGHEFVENYVVAAIYPSQRNKFKYQFYIDTVYFVDTSEQN